MRKMSAFLPILRIHDFSLLHKSICAICILVFIRGVLSFTRSHSHFAFSMFHVAATGHNITVDLQNYRAFIGLKSILGEKFKHRAREQDQDFAIRSRYSLRARCLTVTSRKVPPTIPSPSSSATTFSTGQTHNSSGLTHQCD